MKKSFSGFTVIELLVVISIISILASIILSSMAGAREKAKGAKAQMELEELRTAITMLVNDTGKGPGGCPMDADTDREISLNGDHNDDGIIDTETYDGLLNTPSISGTVCRDGDTYCWNDQITKTNPKCKWTSTDLGKWRGPYTKINLDPWGSPYRYDPDYQFQVLVSDPSQCDTQNMHQALVSLGPNKAWNYPCGAVPHDDIEIPFGTIKR